MTAKLLMVQGTASSAGKSMLVTALCRIFRQEGIRVAPFKPWNMSLNSAPTPDGGEIGRSQAAQAEAASLRPHVDMNPLLLKPEAGGKSQVVVLGKVTKSLAPVDYYTRKAELWQVVVDSLARMRASYDLVLIEGAGSPAEINLREHDIANMQVALHACAPVLLVGDIDRGGVFASLVGTMDLLLPEERDLVSGLVINKFRGDVTLLQPGLDFLAERTGRPVMGVIPYLRDLHIADEDSVSLEGRSQSRSSAGDLDIAVVKLPHISNFDEFAALEAESQVSLRYVESPDYLQTPDMVVIPGTKTTVSDLAFLRRCGMAEAITRLAATGVPVLGICGGFQMLGKRILDPDAVESPELEVAGLGLLSVTTTFLSSKRTQHTKVLVTAPDGIFRHAAGEVVDGYEIHMGTTVADGAEQVFRVLDGEDAGHPDGAVSVSGQVAGTYLHGLFENPAIRRSVLCALAERKGVPLPTISSKSSREDDYDRLADCVRASLDMDGIRRLLDHQA